MPWHRHAQQAQQIEGIIAGLASKYEPREFAQFMPSDWRKPKQKRKGSLRQDLTILRAVYGGKR